MGTIELEDALISHPAVAEVSVVGKKDDIKGEVPIGFVVLTNSRTPSRELAEELKRHVRKIIGPIATFSDIYFVPGLPKTRSGKIMRRVVKALVEGETVGDITTLEDQNSVDFIIKALED